jgi:N-formylmaleamate deformylase
MVAPAQSAGAPANPTGLLKAVARPPVSAQGAGASRMAGIRIVLRYGKSAMGASMTNWIRGVCVANRINIHYLRTGGCKPPLILLHRLTGSGACWIALARALEGDYDGIMPDARGHAKSSAPLHGYLYRDHASDVIGLIEALGLAAPVLLGHSMGGMTAAVVASQVGPAIGGVILADPTFLSPRRQHEVHESNVIEQHRRFLSLNRGQVIAEARHRHPHRSFELIELIPDARLQTEISAFEVLRPPNPEYRQLVSAISVPVLLVIGTMVLFPSKRTRTAQV